MEKEGEKKTFINLVLSNKVCSTSPSGDVIQRSSAPTGSQAVCPHRRKTWPPGFSFLLGSVPAPHSWMPSFSRLLLLLLLQLLPCAGDQASWQRAAGAATCALSTFPYLTPPSTRKKDEGEQLPLLTLRHPQISALLSPLRRTQVP